MKRTDGQLCLKVAYALFDLGKLLLIGAACTDSCVLARITRSITLPAPKEHEILWPT
jgi:hypothetical protein